LLKPPGRVSIDEHGEKPKTAGRVKDGGVKVVKGNVAVHGRIVRKDLAVSGTKAKTARFAGSGHSRPDGTIQKIIDK
jgi:hypothetical protein